MKDPDQLTAAINNASSAAKQPEITELVVSESLSPAAEAEQWLQVALVGRNKAALSEPNDPVADRINDVRRALRDPNARVSDDGIFADFLKLSEGPTAETWNKLQKARRDVERWERTVRDYDNDGNRYFGLPKLAPGWTEQRRLYEEEAGKARVKASKIHDDLVSKARRYIVDLEERLR